MFVTVDAYIHEKWSGSVGDGYDIAVLKLDKEANLTLPHLGSANVPMDDGTFFTATGWGTTKKVLAPKYLHVTDELTKESPDKCKEPPVHVDPGSWICAGGSGEDTCRGKRSTLQSYVR